MVEVGISGLLITGCRLDAKVASWVSLPSTTGHHFRGRKPVSEQLTSSQPLDPDRPIVSLLDDGRWSYRASALGHCAEALLAARQGFQGMAPPPKMQAVFDDGKRAEPHILARIADEHGWKLAVNQLVLDPLTVGTQAIVEGSIDAFGTHEFYGPAGVEVKNVAQSTWDNWHRHHWGDPLFAGYSWQLSVYWHALNGTFFEQAGTVPILFGIHNKATGDIDLTLISEPLVPLARIVARVMEIEIRARRGDTPICTTPRYPCPYWYLHPEDQATDLDPIVLAKIDTLATEYKRATALAADADRLKTEAKAALLDLLPRDDNDKLTSVRTDNFTVTPQTRRSYGFDQNQLAADHPDIDMEKYKTVSESAPFVNVTPRKNTKET